jgi:hypothetical protein
MELRIPQNEGPDETGNELQPGDEITVDPDSKFRGRNASR